LVKSARKVVFKNIDIAFGESLSEKEKYNLAKNSFINFGKSIFELIYSPSLNKRYYEEHTVLHNDEVVQNSYKKGKGVIAVTAHLGNWEWLGSSYAQLGNKLSVIARPLDNRKLDRYVEKYREQKGFSIIPKKVAFKKGIKALNNNHALGILVDQNAAVGGIFVPFFGFNASTVKGPLFYHNKTNAPIHVAYSVRGKDDKHHIYLSEEIFLVKDVFSIPAELKKNPFEESDYNIFISNILSDYLEIDRITQLDKLLKKLSGKDKRKLMDRFNMWKITKYIENAVRKYPEQWFWLHPRWKKRPDGEKGIY